MAEPVGRLFISNTLFQVPAAFAGELAKPSLRRRLQIVARLHGRMTFAMLLFDMRGNVMLGSDGQTATEQKSSKPIPPIVKRD